MGQVNHVWKNYLKDKRRFADLFNGTCWRGQQVICEENLEDDSETGVVLVQNSKAGNLKKAERSRDIKMHMTDGGILRILAVEDQNQVDYSMPFRNMEYDTMDYGKQLSGIRKKNLESDDFSTNAEWICRIKKTDKLTPVFTLCLYHGEAPWDGPRTLRDMMKPEALQEPFNQLFSDYPFHLYCVNEEQHPEVFSTELRLLFEILKYRKDKVGLQTLLETREEYQHLDEETLEVATVTMNLPRMWEHRKEYHEEEGYNMCQAVKEWMEDSKSEGRAEGKAEGKAEGMECVLKLIDQLIAEGRDELIPQLSKDRELLQKLCEEYGVEK